jgi:hypothetical protein
MEPKGHQERLYSWPDAVERLKAGLLVKING